MIKFLVKIKKDCTGAFSLMALTLSLMIFSSFLINVLKLHQNSQLLAERLNTYLCHRYLHHHISQFVSTIGVTNKILLALFISQKTHPLNPAEVLLEKSTKIYQQVSYLSYMKKIAKNRYCSFKQALSYIKSNPYKTTAMIKLKRNLIGLVALRKKKWSTIISPEIHVDNLTQFFIIKVNYNLSTNLSSELKNRVKEISPNKAVSWWKSLYGSPFFSQ